ncbi:MAG: hypothetical protein K2K36_07860, partial [Muribaculaceae bacterium]|nr:hypothetical protein [Muribaculaceae bacterium]
FMSNTVSAAEFLGKLQNTNKLTTEVNFTLLSAGFRAFGGYNTIGISARTEAGVNLPKDFFRFMKLGQTGPETHYSFSDLRFKARAFGEIALGHQRKITKELSAGMKVKLLLGIANADASIRQMDVTLSNKLWSIRAQGEMNIAAGDGLYVPTNFESGKKLDKPEMRDQIDYDGIDYDHFGLGGVGLAFDLGATYDMSRFVDGLTLSAALTDLGFIHWKHNVRALTPDTDWKFEGFQNVAFDSAQDDYENNKLSEQVDHIFDDLEDAVNFRRVSEGGSNSTPLSATLTIGAEYKMPFYKRLSGGFLFTQRFAGPFSWTEGRFSANVKPVNWFDAAINYGASTFGNSFGWIINFHPKGFTFFIGSDHQFFKVTPQYVPVNNANFQFNFGMSITFGKRKV